MSAVFFLKSSFQRAEVYFCVSEKFIIVLLYQTVLFVLFRHGLESNVLRFVAYMATDNPVDKDRKFIISYFLSDDTVAVFEPPQRNSGDDLNSMKRLGL